MAVLYKRQIKTTVAGLTIEEPRQRLALDRFSDQTQDKGVLTIWNLSPDHESRIEDRGSTIQIEAGYPETTALIFDGTVQKVVKAREQTARIMRITLGDKLHGVETLGALSNLRLNGVWLSRDVARHLIHDMGLAPGPLDAIPADATFTDFVWINGRSDAGLTNLLRGSTPSLAHVHWFEENGLVRFSVPKEKQSDAPTIELSPQTGLIESPRRTDEGAEAKCFLNPAIVLGSQVNLDSEALTGSWKVVAMRHAGDNWTDEFTTNLDLRPL